MSKGPWTRGPASAGRYSYFERWQKPLGATIQPHAILDSSGRVILIRSYPRKTTSNTVIPIPDDCKCKVGYRWTGKEFVP